jgi:ABC-type dipeptide/oligopeptide/nickel transport system ATPase component
LQLLRLQVEGGFLDGLDLQFVPGLNVIIGPRGSGKTSALGLIRFVFAAPPYSQHIEHLVQAQVKAILGDGLVTATARQDDQDLRFVRSAIDPAPRRSKPSSGRISDLIVLSQGEIESVGIDTDGRRRILDSFRSSEGLDPVESASAALIRSLTVQAAGLRRGLDELESTAEALMPVPELLAEARAAAPLAAARLERADVRKREYDELAARLAARSVAGDAVAFAYEQTSVLLQDLSGIDIGSFSLDEWPQAGGEVDELATSRQRLATALASFELAKEAVAATALQIQELAAQSLSRRVTTEQEARALRSEIEEISTGAGAALKRVTDLEEQVSQLSALNDLVAQRAAQWREARAERDTALDRLDVVRSTRRNERSQVAGFLTADLGSAIKVAVSGDPSRGPYRDELINRLKGSGLQYTVLATEIAMRISPRELVEMAEDNQAARFAELMGIPRDRAIRVIDHLRRSDLADLVVAQLEDNIEISLLDGTEYKPIEQLSVGQRCTAILPILLRHSDRVLVIDQPEDNLDNAYIVTTLVKALRGRSASSQFIFATHNPNIPVLCDANRVSVLGSDGRRGYEVTAGALDSPLIVDSITTLMEGGKAAFEARADFYRSHEAR